MKVANIYKRLLGLTQNLPVVMKL